MITIKCKSKIAEQMLANDLAKQKNIEVVVEEILSESEFKSRVMKEKDVYALVSDDFGKLSKIASEDFKDIFYLQDETRGIIGRTKAGINVLYFEFKSLFGWAHDKESLQRVKK